MIHLERPNYTDLVRQLREQQARGLDGVSIETFLSYVPKDW